MRIFNRIILIICTSLFFLSFICGEPIEIAEGPYIDVNKSYNYIGGSTEYDLVDTNENSNLTYNLDLGVSTKDVYFIFTNIHLGATATAPEVQSLQDDENVVFNSNTYAHATEIIEDNFTLTKGLPEISEFNRKNHSKESSTSFTNIRNNFNTISAPLFDVLNTQNDFCYDYNPKTKTPMMVTATCRKIISSPDGKILNIWVADADWDETIPSALGKVNPDMLNALGDAFLKSDNSKNDIYHWVTNIYGSEWGNHSYPNMIGNNNGEITILLFDIPTSGVAGYFYSKDNYTNLSYSNRRIMFYLDAVYYADGTGGLPGWDVSDSMPSQIISTIAHEFQHMIHYYQKMILHNLQTNSETWIDEMCSLVTEDLVSDKLEIRGPRGIAISSPGTPGITSGRLSRYNRYNNSALITWDGSLDDYAIKYAFGAYLARNFGGALLFQSIVQNTYTNYYAVDSAIQSAGGDAFSIVLRKWGIANILSDIDTTNAPIKYNNGTNWMTSSIGTPAITYNLGSINLYNYSYPPTIYNSSDLPTTDLNMGSNRYYKAGTGVTGMQTWNVKLNKYTRLTVLIRD
jgi:hypothetical protein